MAPGRLLAVFVFATLAVVTPLTAFSVRIRQGSYTDIAEGDTKTISCIGAGISRNSAVAWTWSVSTASYGNLPAVTCQRQLCGPCVSSRRDVTVQGCSGYTTITFRNISRHMGGRLTCSATDSQNLTRSASTRLNVYRIPVLHNCTVDVIRQNWSTVLSCDVSRALSTENKYTFKVLEAYLPATDCKEIDSQVASCLRGWYSAKKSPVKCTRHSERPFHQSLAAYVNRTDHTEYYRGRLVHSWLLDPVPAQKWIVWIKVCTGVSSACTSFQANMSRDDSAKAMPSKPKHNCQSYVPERETSRCPCRTSFLGSPAGRLVWKRGAVVIAAGRYGVQTILSLPRTIARGQGEGGSSEGVVCQVDWIVPSHATSPVALAYGPDRVDIAAYQLYGHNGTLVIMVGCQVIGLSPSTPDMVSWGGPCRGQTGFTCILDPPEKSVQGTKVICLVTNTRNHGRSLKAETIIKTEKPEKPADRMKWAAVGGVVALAVIVALALLLLLIVKMYRRQCPCAGPANDSTEAQGTPDSHMYEVIRPSGPSAQNTQRKRGNRNNRNRNNDNRTRNNRNRNNDNRNKGRREHVYENSPFDDHQGGHV